MSNNMEDIKGSKGLTFKAEKLIFKLFKLCDINNTFEDKNKNLYKNYLKVKNKMKNKIRKTRTIKTIILMVTITILFIQGLPITSFYSLEYGFSNITLKISGIGEKNIFCSKTNYFNTSYYPNEIYINGEKQDNIAYNYYFNQSENYVELIWNNTINCTKYMFYDCKDITEINLRNFKICFLDVHH